MITKNDMKHKYSSEYDRQKNYRQILQKASKRVVPYRLIAAMASVILVFCIIPKQFSKSADSAVSDEYATEIGPEIILNINQGNDDLKNYDVSSSLRADMELKKYELEELEVMIEDICPEGFTASEPVRFAIQNKESNSEMSSYVCIDFSKGNQNIQVAYSENGRPFRDYVLSPDESVSILDGVEILITQQPDLNLYLCVFELNGYYFDVETSQISETELLDFLLNLIAEVRKVQ